MILVYCDEYEQLEIDNLIYHSTFYKFNYIVNNPTRIYITKNSINFEDFIKELYLSSIFILKDVIRDDRRLYISGSPPYFGVCDLGSLNKKLKELYPNEEIIFDVQFWIENSYDILTRLYDSSNIRYTNNPIKLSFKENFKHKNIFQKD